MLSRRSIVTCVRHRNEMRQAFVFLPSWCMRQSLHHEDELEYARSRNTDKWAIR